MMQTDDTHHQKKRKIQEEKILYTSTKLWKTVTVADLLKTSDVHLKGSRQLYI